MPAGAGSDDGRPLMWRPSGIDRSTAAFIGLVVLSLVLVTVDLRASGEGLGGTLRDGVADRLHPGAEGGGLRHPPGGGLLRGDLRPGGAAGREPAAPAAGGRPRAAAGRDREPAAPGRGAGGRSWPSSLPGSSTRWPPGCWPPAPSDFDAIRLIDKGRRARHHRGHAGDRRGGAGGPGGGGHRDLGPDPPHHRPHHAGGGAGGAHRRDRDPHRAGRRPAAAGDVQHRRRPHRGGPAGHRRRALPGRASRWPGSPRTPRPRWASRCAPRRLPRRSCPGWTT